MTNAGTAPATKDDIRMLMDEFGKMYDSMEKWKDWLHSDMETWKQELKAHFDLSVEQTRYELVSANREEIEVLKDGHRENRKRIVALERTTGLAA
jgi:hypothetical protein